MMCDTFQSNLDKFRKLIQIQDQVRDIMRKEEGDNFNYLRKLDKEISRAIHLCYGKKVGSVTNENWDE